MTDRWQREDEARQARLLEKLIRRLPADNYTRGAGRVAEPTTVRRSVTPAAPLAPTDPNVDGVPVGGDLAGVLPNPTVDGLQGFAVGTAAPGNGQVLTWSTATSQWAPAAASGGVDELSDLSDVGTAVPTDGQVLTYSTASAEWGPAAGGATLTQGTVTVATAATTGTAAHGLGFTPLVANFQVTPLGAWGSAVSFWADTVDGTNMVVAVNTAPGTAVPFAWRHTSSPVYEIEVFTAGGTWDWTAAGSPSTVDVLVVAGGGGGGGSLTVANGGGGGGAGGVLINYAVAVAANQTITVGPGGAGGSVGTAGSNSSFGALVVATGGGRGGGWVAGPAYTAASGGGSGGGGGGLGTGTSSGGAGVVGQGSNGADGSIGVANRPGGGGGGKDAVGGAYSGSNGGPGGAGVAVPEVFDGVGVPSHVGGGGGAGADGTTAGAGGLGGGGDGNTAGAGVAGTANTGGGGGGGAGTGDTPGGDGGSGIVIVRWVTG